MKVSVIIPIYNEAKYINNCLESLNLQSLKPMEVIVVDDGSTDNSLDILAKLPTTHYSLNILKQNHQGAGAARNLGAKKATGNILIFIDADMEFDTHFIKLLIAPIKAGKSKGTFSKLEYVANWDNPWARSWSFCLGEFTKKLIPVNFPDTSPVFRAVLTSEFISVGGFDLRGYDDDWTLSEKLGYQATVASGAKYYHYNPDSAKEIFFQARWSAIRKYKLKILGKLIRLAKLILSTFTLISPLIIYKRTKSIYGFVGKIVYNFGQISGLAISLTSKKVSK